MPSDGLHLPFQGKANPGGSELVGISWSFQASLSKRGLYPDLWLPDQNEAEGRVVMPSKTKQELWKSTKVTWQRESHGIR